MLRVVVTIVLPLLLPTALYLGWIWLTRWAEGGAHGSEAMRWATLPWLWLAGAGVLLLAVMLFVVTVGFGTAERGVYVPPRWEHGHIVPGHIQPEREP